MKMVQRKAPNKLGIQADLIITSHDHHLQNQNRLMKQFISHSHHHQDGKIRKPEVKRKMMKKSRSFKSPPSPRTPPPPPSRDAPTTSTKNYMKSTSCFDARKSTSGGKKTAAAKSSARTLMTKTPSFKKRAGLFGGHVAEVQRATCSSTLKDSKFPSYLELSCGGTESEGVSAVKVCPYSYCSLNGHLHKHASMPPLKRFLSAKRRALVKNVSTPEGEEKVGFFVEIYADKEEEVEQKQVVLESFPDDEPPRSDEESVEDEEESSGFDESIDARICSDEDRCEDLFEGVGEFDDGGEEIEEESFEAEEENANEKEDRIEKENEREEEIASSDLFVRSSQSEEETMEIEVEVESFCFGGLIDSQLCCDEDECGDLSEHEAEEFDVVEEIEGRFEAEEDQSGEVSGEANDCEEIASSDLSQSSVIEESSDLEIVDDEDTNQVSAEANDCKEIACSDLSQRIVVEKRSDLEIVDDDDTNEASENGPSSNVSEEIARLDHEIVDTSAQNIEIDIHRDSESGRTAKNQRQSSDPLENEEELRSKWKRSKREADDSGGSVSGFNPRDPNFLELTLEPEEEKVDLKHQEADKRKSSEEWMIDRALQRMVNELGQRKRRVTLLVEAFETITPVRIRREPVHRRNHYRHIPSSSVFQHTIWPVQACN